MTTLDSLRILIALAVLKNTPVDQTHSSYILTLRDSFPSSSSEEPPFVDFWKVHALQLEKECIQLRTALGKLQIRSFILDSHTSCTPSAAPAPEYIESSAPSSSETTGNSDITKKKKSGKKKKAAVTDSSAEVENLTDILKFGRIGLGRLGRPFEAMNTFLQLWSVSDRPGFPRKIFFSATRDVLKALSSAFNEATRTTTNLKALQVVQATICALVDKAVPLVLTWITEDDDGAVSLLFDNLLDLFMNPLIPAFLILSERNLSYMRNASAGDDSPGRQQATDYVDGRVSILALLQITFSHIQSALVANKDSPSTRLACADFSVMIHSFILVIVRHLRDILREGDATQKQKPTRRRRIRRLAVKDTFWYLCSAVHFLLDLQGGVESTRQQHRIELLNQTTLDIMVDLVLFQDRKRGSMNSERHEDSVAEAINYLVLDDMGYRMILGLVERLLVKD